MWMSAVNLEAATTYIVYGFSQTEEIYGVYETLNNKITTIPKNAAIISCKNGVYIH